jgi:hypothetical protein
MIYVIVDDDLNMRNKIDVSHLKNPKFDLITWYKTHTEKEGIFYEKYIEKHEGAYVHEPQMAPITVN